MPTIDHVFYIPAILMAGLYAGWRLGINAARAEYARRERERQK